MKKSYFSVQKHLCADCTLALRRFIGGLDGVESIDVEGGRIAVSFDENEIGPDQVAAITKDSIRKLGYEVEE